MNIDYKLIGIRIKNKRKSLHLTQEKLSEEMGVSVGYISQIERGVTKINLDTLAHIANLFDCDVSSFIQSSNVSTNSYLSNEIEELFQQLSESEKNILCALLRTYINEK